MHLAGVELQGIEPFGALDLSFCESDDAVRMLTVVHGAPGTGKSSLLHAIAHTRPGMTSPLTRVTAPPEALPAARCAWSLGDDDPKRPHPLIVTGPRWQQGGDAQGQRREQIHFDAQAKLGGFALLAIGAQRWFARQPISLAAPRASTLRWDPRASFDAPDPPRAELGRATKQVLAHAEIAALIAGRSERSQRANDPRLFSAAVRGAVGHILQPTGWSYEGLDPDTFEPLFCADGESGVGEVVGFDATPRAVRELIAIAVLTVRTLWAAYPGRNPSDSEGVVLIDELDLHQPDAVAVALPHRLRTMLPRVQWVLTTQSARVASAVEAESVVGLRREYDAIELVEGVRARTH